jgi:hypothetical protein
MFDLYCEKVFGPPGRKLEPADYADAVSTEELTAHVRALEARTAAPHDRAALPGHPAALDTGELAR